MIEAKTQIDEASLKRLITAMKELEPTSIKDLRRELKTEIKPIAAVIQSRVPSSSPFRGMEQNLYGRVQWVQPKVTVSFTPGKRGKFDTVPLITLVATGSANRLGFDYTENAGVRKRRPAPRSRSYHRSIDRAPRRHNVTTQGDALIEKARKESRFNYKAGHFAYGTFLSQRPAMLQIVEKILNKTAERFNVKLERL
jgi:hypothetical protein